MTKLNRLLKRYKSLTLSKMIASYIFKITHLDNSTAVYDNDGNLVMKNSLHISLKNEDKNEKR